MPSEGFEPAIPASQGPQTQALDREAIGISWRPFPKTKSPFIRFVWLPEDCHTDWPKHVAVNFIALGVVLYIITGLVNTPERRDPSLAFYQFIQAHTQITKWEIRQLLLLHRLLWRPTLMTFIWRQGNSDVILLYIHYVTACGLNALSRVNVVATVRQTSLFSRLRFYTVFCFSRLACEMKTDSETNSFSGNVISMKTSSGHSGNWGGGRGQI